MRHSKKNRKASYLQILDCLLIDKRNRTYSADAEAIDMIHLGSDHRSVTAHRMSTRCNRQATSMETSEVHESTERIHEIERRFDELEKRFTGKHDAAANEKVGETERQHTTTKTQRE